MQHEAVDRVRAALAVHDIEPRVVWFDDAVTTAQLAADALGVEVGQIANSLIFTLDDEPILVLTSGAHRVDTDWLGERLGGRIGRADKDTVKSATGQTIGGVAPLGHLTTLPTYIDEMLARFDEVWAAAGHPKSVYATTFEELLRVTGAEVVSVERV
ncbi:MAG TPA: YbaK/EbsC family protein [Microbacteriaceae bacterium]|nr:YbaK/EbsC family protein [Microbacteriaceae bacterium]